MKKSAFPTLSQVRKRHDALIDGLRTARTAGGLSPVEIPPEIAQDTAGFIAELHGMGAALYADGDRSATQSLMAYWINALYRAEWYQRRNEEPPAPELAAFAPEAQPPLTDEDYPWPRCDHCGETPELPALWQRLSAQGLEILKARRLLGVTGAAGCGRSNLIATSLLPGVRQGGLGELVEHSLTPDEDFTGDADADQDLVFLSPLLKLARSVAGATGPGLDAAGLVRDPAALARLLDGTGQRHLVVVQDLHHLFMLSDDPFELEPSAGQRAFIEALTCIATSEAGHYVIVDVQTEYLARLRAFTELHQLLERPIGASGADGWLIVSLENQELRRFIVEPADRVGLHFEAGLVDRIVFEHQSEPAAVTILLFTLRRLWTDMLTYQDRRNMITWQNYQRVGSGRLVLELAADAATKAVLDGEAPEEEAALDAVRRVFVELVRLMPGSAWWLPRVPRAAIEAALVQAGHPAARVQRILAEFMRVGLFVESPPAPGGTTLRIFHDALIGRWTRLVQWLENERTAKRLRWLLRTDAREWNFLLQPPPAAKHESGRASWRERFDRFRRRQARLWRGTKLREAEAFTDLPAREQRFLSQSRKTYYATLGFMIFMAVSIPAIVIIGLLMRVEGFADFDAAQIMDRGVSMITAGDPSLAGCLLVEAHKHELRAPSRMALKWLPTWLQPASMRESEAAHLLSVGMALRRQPGLHNLMAVPDNLVTLEMSPSGRFAVFACRLPGAADGRLMLWDLAGQNMTALLEGKDVKVGRVTFARSAGRISDTLVAAGGSTASGKKGVVLVWDLRRTAGHPLRIDTASAVTDLAFQPTPADENRQRLAIATSDEAAVPVRGAVEVFEVTANPGQLRASDGLVLESARILAASRFTPLLDFPATRLAFSPTGALAVAYLDRDAEAGHVAVFERLEDGAWKAAELRGDLLPVNELAFSNGRNEILALASGITSSGAGSVRIFRRDNGDWFEPRPSLQLGGEILRVAFNPVGGSLVATASNGVIGIWSVDDDGTATPIREISEGGWPFSVAWSPDGRQIAVGNRDRHARLWDVATGRLVVPPLYQGATVSSVAFTPDSSRLLAATVQSARLWSTAPREFSLLPVRAVERASRAIFSADGHHIAVVSQLNGQARDGVPESELAIWDDQALVPARRFQQLPELSKIAISDDGAFVAALSARRSGSDKPLELRVWVTASSQLRKIMVPAKTDFLGFTSGKNRRLLVAGSDSEPASGHLQLFDVSPEQESLTAPAVKMAFRVTAFTSNADGSRLIIGGGNGGIASVDAVTSPPRVNAALKCHKETVTALALSEDGRRLLSGSTDDTARLLAVGGDGLISVLPEPKSSDERRHTADVTSVSFSHNSRRAVSTGRDSAAILYDITRDSLRPIAVMQHQGVINHHAFSPDDRWLATGADDGVSVWCVGSDQKLWLGKRVAALPHRYPLAGLAFAGEDKSRPGSPYDLRSIAIDRNSRSTTAAQVEAYRWNLAIEKGTLDAARSTAELLAGRTLSQENPPSPVNLKIDELRARWKAFGSRAGAEDPSGNPNRNQALLAATASQWKAARRHLLAWREADRHLFDPGTDSVAGTDALKFAVEVFEAARDPANVLTTVETLRGKLADVPDQQRRYMEKHGAACVQFARNPAPWDRDKLLADAGADFQTLAASEPNEWRWPVREAEIHVMRADWPRALERLEKSKEILAGANDAEKQQSTGTQDQRIAAIHLIRAAEARRSGDTDFAAKEEAAWLALARSAMDRQRNATATSKARLAWPLVLCATNEKDVVDTGLAFAEEGFKERPDSYARTNTYAAALLRAGRVEEAEENLVEAIRLFEREERRSNAQPSERKERPEGRPSDWIVHSLILIARSELEGDERKKSATLKEAREELTKARGMIDKPPADAQSEWRATWNNLDLRVLVAEAERKLGPHEAP